MAGETAKLLASIELQDKFSKTADKFSSTVSGMERQTSTLGKVGAEASRGATVAAGNIAKIGVVTGIALGGIITKSVQAASNLQQASGAVESVFGDAGDSLRDFAKTADQTTGLSERAVLEMGAVFGAQLQGMGFEAQEAAKHTIDLEQRGADLAATFGGTTADAVEAISSLLRGERDPIEKYGVSLKQVDISARIAERGLDTSTAAAKKQSEAIAALELFYEQTTAAQGQFSRETDTLAGAQQRLKARLENTGATIGTALLPRVAEVAERLNQALVEHAPAIESFAASLPGVFDKLIGIVENLPWGAIASSFELMGKGAEALLTAFTSLPPWVQTAVLTGWGLNKLTGGALGNIGKILGQAAFGKLRGATPANPVFTKEVGIPGVGGGGKGGVPLAGAPAAAAAGGGALAGALALGGGVLLPFAMFNLLPELFKVEGAKPVSAQRTLDDGTVVKLDPTQTAMFTGLMPSFQANVEKVGGRIVEQGARTAGAVWDVEASLDDTRQDVRDLKDPLVTLGKIQEAEKATVAAGAAAMQARLDRATAAIGETSAAIRSTSGNTAAQLARIEGVERTTAAATQQVANKDFSPRFENVTNVGINASFVISATSVSRSIQIQQSASQTSFSGRGGDSRF